jgi:hypothetical protein
MGSASIVFPRSVAADRSLRRFAMLRLRLAHLSNRARLADEDDEPVTRRRAAKNCRCSPHCHICELSSDTKRIFLFATGFSALFRLAGAADWKNGGEPV